MARPTPVFGSLLQTSEAPEGPRDVRVFEEGRFLYASFDFGREQMLDVRAHDRLDLLQYWLEWMSPVPAASAVADSSSPLGARERLERHERTPERPGQATSSSTEEEPLGEFLTSIGRHEREPRRRMTLDEYLTV